MQKVKAFLQLNINIPLPTLHLPMKNYTQPATSKLVKQFDNDLKKFLLADLSAFKVKSHFVAKPVIQLSTASAA